jgi:hypothetical protein
MWSLVVAGLWSSMFPAPSSGQQPVEFARERIVIFVDGANIAVDGYYVLKNPTPRDRIQSLFYPFPVDSAHTFPDSISVWQNEEPVPFERVVDGVVFSVEIPAEKSVGFRVVYRQTCFDNTGCYILTTTSAWSRPLEWADFEIIFAEGVELEWASYELTPISKSEGLSRYEFSREDFMPDKDMCMRWTAMPASDTSP